MAASLVEEADPCSYAPHQTGFHREESPSGSIYIINFKTVKDPQKAFQLIQSVPEVEKNQTVNVVCNEAEAHEDVSVSSDQPATRSSRAGPPGNSLINSFLLYTFAFSVQKNRIYLQTDHFSNPYEYR